MKKVLLSSLVAVSLLSTGLFAKEYTLDNVGGKIKFPFGKIKLP